MYELELPLGKKQKLTRTVNVVDTVAPVIELINGNLLRLDYGMPYTEHGYNISDNYDSNENLKVNVTYDKEIDSYVSGTYIINYEVVDTSGNSSKVTREVIVNPYEKIKVINGITYVDGVLIANKQYGLPSTYNPGINAEAYNQLVIMQNDARNLGHNLPLVSGFRSYYSQQIIYNNYVSIHGVEQTDTFSARPGHSEHQTGLAFDVGAIDNSMGEWPVGIWLAENAHKYGFIIRYPQGKQHITGYQYEPWHIRYLGVDLANKVYNSGLTLEEYLGI
ncbi:MAG: D-alanyl-D-alanine carboxypeptidase family protein [Bacilli bacterium]|nr:D-alanyl-D-alanine carboxypeptidase family protein [Bacilli bacterium]